MDGLVGTLLGPEGTGTVVSGASGLLGPMTALLMWGVVLVGLVVF